ncbi:MAG: hypothetical protein PHF57_11110 [Methanoregula sp.]|jgi:hypothetical protein|nr:hypothetical protein [Methanoregula sp.]MDD5023981.1 hypothetical protein [Methanoregula sp.]MDD5188743.1 hypothetical protein [Methanoregula sp.]
MAEESKQESPQEPQAEPNTEQTEEPLFDVLVPPGVPRTIISEIATKFDVEVVERKQRLKFANMDGDERELLAFRAKQDVAIQVEQYMFDRLKNFIGE